MSRARPERPIAGMSLIEIMLVLVVIGVFAGMAVPRFGVATEQTNVDQGAAALHTVWVAERLWWLDHHAFCAQLGTLADARLVDRALVDETAPLTLSILGATATTFTAQLARTGSDNWSGDLVIDESGEVTGFIADEAGLHVVP
jgi:prepilin-type N-terminal cleavage/methylation domain-containing protein